MIISSISKRDNIYQVEIPESEILRLDLLPGERVRIDLARTTPPSPTAAQTRDFIEREIEALAEVMKYLKDA